MLIRCPGCDTPTGGRTEADIRVNGYPQDRGTFTRSSGYVEQADLHSPQTTVAEALWFSSRLRLPPSVSKADVLAFTHRVMELVELQPLRQGFRIYNLGFRVHT